MSTARKEFENASRLTCNGRPSVAGTLALARLEFSAGANAEALRLYRSALRACPGCPAEVRLGIGACWLSESLARKRSMWLRGWAGLRSV